MLLWFWNFIDAAGFSSAHAAALTLTTRIALAAGLNLALMLLFGRPVIGWLRGRFRESIDNRSAAIERLHAHKQSTPTMGGLGILAAFCGSLVLLGDWRNPCVGLAMLVAIGLGMVGFIDDYAKIHARRINAAGIKPRRGLSARAKLAGQTIVAAIAASGLTYWLSGVPDGLALRLPFGTSAIDLGIWFLPLAMLAIVGSSNAVNLTDGLDGLAAGCLVAAFGTLTVIAALLGHEVSVVAAAALGAVCGFLWFNRHPAAVFMGDTGALPLGGLLAFAALAARVELLLLVLGGVFVVEAASVIVQVAAFRTTGRRVFLCAPLHHHFQLRGWSEPKVVARFWCAAVLCAVCAFGGWLMFNGASDPSRTAWRRIQTRPQALIGMRQQQPERLR